MENECGSCPMEKVRKIEYRFLSSHLNEMKMRVGKLETQLSRGILLLVANLTGVVITLAKMVMGA